MTKPEICVLVAGVGGGGTGRELMKAFSVAEQKYKIVATDMWENSFGLFETPNRYVIPPANSADYIESLLKICKKEKVQAIATGSEPELRKVSQNRKIFEEVGIKILLNSWEIIEKCTDKLELMKFLSSNNIEHPKFFLYEKESDIKKIENFPVVIKPTIGSGSRGVFFAQDEDEALFFSNYLKKYGYKPLIQEHVGNFDEEYSIGILYADNGKLQTSIAMKRILGSGLSTREIIVNPKSGKKYMISSGISQGIIDDFKEIREKAMKIVSLINPHGPINIQCRKTNSGIVPFEVNPRFSGTTGARSLVGLNEPDIFCRYCLFGEIPKKIDYKHGYVVRELSEKFISQVDAKKVPRI